MSTKEAKAILMEMRPERPVKTEGRRRQAAIDIALATMEAYEQLIKTMEARK